MPEFQKPVVELIRGRSSWRSYDGRVLLAADRDALTAYLATITAGPFGGRVRLGLVAAAEEDAAVLKGLGTYGAINGARAFLVGAVAAGPMDMEDFGFAFEKAILYATSLGLGTCWLGATFTRTSFVARFGLREGEVMPAASPVGYPAADRTAVDRFTRAGARSEGRKPWPELFFDSGFGAPLLREQAGPYAESLEMVRLGPSASNRQPWRLVRAAGGKGYHLFVRRTRAYKSLFSARGQDLQRLDMGIAMCHFELSAREAGLAGEWKVLPAAPDIGSLPERTSYIVSWLSG